MRRLIFMMGIAIGLMTNVIAQDSTNLKGIGYREYLWKPPYSDWQIPNYEHYQPDPKIIEKCVSKLDKDIRIVIVMGTWCSDSRREVPRFYKILDLIQFPMYNTKLIFVDRDKDDGAGQANKLKIKKVPTFIITDQYGDELGRIVESPHKSLEKDLLKLLKKK